MSTPSSRDGSWLVERPLRGVRTLRYHDGTPGRNTLQGHPRRRQGYPPAAPLGASPADPVHWLLPTGRTWQSIAAGYVALFAVVIWPLGPVALGLGFWALKVSGHTGAHGRGRAVFAIIVGVLTSIAMLALILELIWPGPDPTSPPHCWCRGDAATCIST